MKKRFSLFLLICLFFCSCATTKVESGVMNVMIYDFSNKGLENVKVFINEKEMGKTDFLGRFCFYGKNEKEYKIRIEKFGYESVESTFIYDEKKVLYFKMGNAEEYFHLSKRAFEEKNYESALGFVEKSLELDKYRNDSLYLKALILIQLEEYENAKETASKIKIKNENKNYVESLLKLIDQKMKKDEKNV